MSYNNRLLFFGVVAGVVFAIVSSLISTIFCMIIGKSLGLIDFDNLNASIGSSNLFMALDLITSSFVIMFSGSIGANIAKNNEMKSGYIVAGVLLFLFFSTGTVKELPFMYNVCAFISVGLSPVFGARYRIRPENL